MDVLVTAMLQYIKENPLDVTVMVCGMTAATLVALGAPQPFFGIAFWIYVVSAICAVISNYKKKSWAMVGLFTYFFFIDSYGVYNWWPF